MALTVVFPMLPPVPLASRHPARSVDAVADAATPRLAALWRGIFRAVRQALSLAAVRVAFLRSRLLAVHTLLDEAWWTHAEVPVRSALPPLALEVVTAAADVQAQDTRRLLDTPVPFVRGLAETDQAVQAYVGQQLTLIGGTTLRTLRRLLRDGVQRDVGAEALARALHMAVGLTPRQQQGLDAMRSRLLAAGQDARQVAHTLAFLRQQALRTRVALIAETQSWTLAQMGARLQVQQAVQTRPDAGLRRYWQVAVAERSCPRCLAIPRLNPEGVGVDAPFHTGSGEVWEPSLHPRCRCSVVTQRSA